MRNRIGALVALVIASVVLSVVALGQGQKGARSRPDMLTHNAPFDSHSLAASKSPKSTVRTISVCQIIGSTEPKSSAANVINPAMLVSLYFKTMEKVDIPWDGKVILLQGPKHGTFVGSGDGYWAYRPAGNYLGFDKATFLVEVGGREVTTVYSFHVVEGGAPSGDEGGYDPYKDPKYCPNGAVWKISLNKESVGRSSLALGSPVWSEYQLRDIDGNLNIPNLAC